MFAFVVHCAGTPLNMEVNFWVFECNAPFHRRPSAFSAMLIDRRLYSIFLSHSWTAATRKQSPSSSKGTSQIHQLCSCICASFISLAAAFSRNRASFTSLPAAFAPIPPWVVGWYYFLSRSRGTADDNATMPLQLLSRSIIQGIRRHQPLVSSAACISILESWNYLQSPCQSEASPKLGARFIDAWPSLSQRARQSVFSECSDYMYAGMRW